MTPLMGGDGRERTWSTEPKVSAREAAGCLAVLLLIISVIAELVLLGIVAYKAIQFDRKCRDYLKNAADANRIPMAKDRLHQALDYIRQKGLTEGHTSILYTSPDEDVGFWYNNLNDAYKSLEQMKPGYTELEESNMLMKLRETILDDREVTLPPGISRFPHNRRWAMYHLFCILSMAILLLVVAKATTD